MKRLIYINQVFCLNANNHILKKDGNNVGLTEKGVQLMLELITHKEEVVTNAYLIEKLWPKSGDSGNYLEQKVCEVRRVFHDNYKDPSSPW